MKKLILFSIFVIFGFQSFSQQDSTGKKNSSQSKKREEQRRRKTMASQQEEGVLVFEKHTAGGVQLRTNGYGAFLELGRSRSPRFTNLYSLEITEIKHPKEEKATGDGFFSNSFVYGKINNFYQAKLGFGQQYVFGQKGNKNGIAVLGIAQGGFSAGLLKPYYVKIRDGSDIKYDSKDSLLFMDPSAIIGGTGFAKGWSELKFSPGVYLKTALRFDFGRYNESINALEIGVSFDYYFSKVPQMVYNEPKQLFIQGHVAYVFGKRK
ncbi:MAG: hypothetical protein EON98_10800 [Chitinophagaceae bacterium]|nr:MAG: hypothetical protein EON98_10800 [Chitinophagaceae bacterium]